MPATAIENALSGRYGPISLKCRFLWYDSQYNFLGDISSAFLQSGSVSMDNFRPVARTASLGILPDNLPMAFDRINHYVQILARVVEPVTSTEYEESLGYFMLDDPVESHNSSGVRIWQLNAADIGVKLVSSNLGGTYSFPAGTNYVTAIETILNLFSFQHSIPPDPRVTPIAFIWPWQTYYSTILTNLCDGINYHYPWTDRNGIFRSRSRIDPSLETVTWSGSTTVEPRMIIDGWRKELASRFSTLGFDNRAVVKITDPLRAVSAVEATNDDPTSPISRVTRNLTRTKEVAIDHVANQATQYEIAKYIVWDAACKALTGNLQTLPDVRRDCHETYALTIAGVESGSLWRVANWTLPLVPGTPMTHRLESAQAVDVNTAVVVAP